MCVSTKRISIIERGRGIFILLCKEDKKKKEKGKKKGGEREKIKCAAFCLYRKREMLHD